MLPIHFTFLLTGLLQTVPADTAPSLVEVLLDYLVPGVALLLLMFALVLAVMQIIEMTRRD